MYLAKIFLWYEFLSAPDLGHWVKVKAGLEYISTHFFKSTLLTSHLFCIEYNTWSLLTWIPLLILHLETLQTGHGRSKKERLWFEKWCYPHSSCQSIQANCQWCKKLHFSLCGDIWSLQPESYQLDSVKGISIKLWSDIVDFWKQIIRCV